MMLEGHRSLHTAVNAGSFGFEQLSQPAGIYQDLYLAGRLVPNKGHFTIAANSSKSHWDGTMLGLFWFAPDKSVGKVVRFHFLSSPVWFV